MRGAIPPLPGVKWPVYETDFSPPSRVEIKNVGSSTSSPPYVFMAWYVVMHTDTFTLFPKETVNILMVITKWNGSAIFRNPT